MEAPALAEQLKRVKAAADRAIKGRVRPPSHAMHACMRMPHKRIGSDIPSPNQLDD